jgi:hypothetical protein
MDQEITSTLLNQISTYLAWLANPVCFRAEQHAAQTISNSTMTQVTCDTTIHDSDGGLSTTSPFSYVIPVAGLWDFFGGVGYSTNATGLRYSMIWQNGAQIAGSSPGLSESSNGTLVDVTAAQIPCQVGDVIGLYTNQITGASMTTQAGGGQCSFFAGRLVSLQNP